MSSPVVRARVSLLQNTRGAGLLLRLLIVASPAVGIAWTRLAAHGAPMSNATAPIGLLAIVLSIVCVAYPDGNLGLVVLALLTGDWLASVHDPASPWALGMAVVFTVFHSSLAAAAVAPPSARWTPAMCRRWLRRPVVLLAASAATALAVSAASRLELAGNGIVLTAALATLAIGGLWAVADRSSPT